MNINDPRSNLLKLATCSFKRQKFQGPQVAELRRFHADWNSMRNCSVGTSNEIVKYQSESQRGDHSSFTYGTYDTCFKQQLCSVLIINCKG